MLGWRRRNDTSEFPQDVVTIIGAETHVRGERLRVETDLRVDGRLETDVVIQGRFVVGKNGAVRGDVVAREMVIGGTVSGNVLVHGSLTLQATAVVHGNIEAARMTIEDGATGRFSTSIGAVHPGEEDTGGCPHDDARSGEQPAHSGDGAAEGYEGAADRISMNPTRARTSKGADRAPNAHDDEQRERATAEVKSNGRDRFW